MQVLVVEGGEQLELLSVGEQEELK